MRGQKPPQKKNKKSKMRKSKSKKKLQITSKEEYILSIKTLFTLCDHISKGFFGNDSSDHDDTLEELDPQEFLWQ